MFPSIIFAVQEMWKQAVRNREPKSMPAPVGKAAAGPPPKIGPLGQAAKAAKAKPLLPTPKGKNAPPKRAASERQAASGQEEPFTFRMVLCR